MNRFAWRPFVGAAIAVVALAGPASAQTDSTNVDLENWMAQLPGAADQPLSKLAIPGTHDSGSYSISKSSAWAITGKKDFGFLSSLPGWAVKPTAAAWSRTQPRPLFWQLADGIRYVDLRLSHEPDGEIYIEHGLRGAKVDDVLDDIAKFAFTHPKEILLVEAARFTNFTAASHDLLVKKIRAALGARLVPDSYGPDATPRQLWALDKNVILLYSDAFADDPSNPDLWSSAATLEFPWANVTKTDALLKANQGYAAARDPKKLFGLYGTVTPDGDMIAKGFFDLGPDSIQALMAKVHPDVQHWLRHELKASVNIVATDWYDAAWDGGSSFVREVLATMDGAHPLVPFDVERKGSGVHRVGLWFHTWADFEWEGVPGATDYEIKLEATSILRNSTSQHSTTTSVHLDRKNLPWDDPIIKGRDYDVSVRALVNGVWHDWSKPKRIKL